MSLYGLNPKKRKTNNTNLSTHMAINKIEAYQIVCDKCGEAYMQSGTNFSLFTDEYDAEQDANEEGWLCKDGKHYCETCWELDENDDVVF